MPAQVGLPECELVQRVHVHRGVFCQPGLLLPTDSTVFHLCPAQHFNSRLPLGPQRPYTSPGFSPSSGVHACWVRARPTSRRPPVALAPHSPTPARAAAQDTATLCAYANLTYREKGDTRGFYVLQIELDLLTSTVLPEDVDVWEATGYDEPRGTRHMRIVGPGVNVEAITRVWLARRDENGAFVTCDPPNGERHARRRTQRV